MHKRQSTFITFFLLFTFCFNTAAFANIVICVDTNFWYPFTYLKDNQATGLHIDIIHEALSRVGIKPTYKPLSWKECLGAAKSGSVDAVATASYRDERALYLNYPAGAAVDSESPFRVTQAGYVVVTPVTNKTGHPNNYRFTGNFKSIPKPIRVPAHYSVIQDLKKEGLQVKIGKGSFSNFQEMSVDQTGSVVDIKDLAEYLATQPEFTNKFKIQPKILNNKSYYLAFSKRGKVKQSEADMIWKQIANVREDQKLMAKFVKKY